jgi:hypothetical protein
MLQVGKPERVTFLILLFLFTAFNMIVVTANENFRTGFLTATGTILGPMTGAIGRHFQKCCLNASLHLLPYFLPCPILAFVSQIRRTGRTPTRAGAARYTLWLLGWLAWFFSGILSFAHAFA